MLSDHCQKLVDVFREIGISVTIKVVNDGLYNYEYVAIGDFPDDIDASEMLRRSYVWFEFCDGNLDTYPATESQYEFFRKGNQTKPEN